jgi:hypothetical protein
LRDNNNPPIHPCEKMDSISRCQWNLVILIRRFWLFLKSKGLVNLIVFSLPLAILVGMLYTAIINDSKSKAGPQQIVAFGKGVDGIPFNKEDPFRFCSNLDQEGLNVIVLDESKVLPDFLIHDWLLYAMFTQVEPKMAVNLILEKGEDEQEIAVVRGPIVRRKGDAMVGEREKEERKIHLWKDGRYKNLFCNNSILVVQTKACSPIPHDQRFIVNYLKMARALSVNVLGVVHSDDDYPDYTRPGPPCQIQHQQLGD